MSVTSTYCFTRIRSPQARSTSTRIRSHFLTFIRHNTSSNHIKQHYTNAPVTITKKINLGLRVWVKRGFSSAATSAFYIYKIRTSAYAISAGPHFTPGRQLSFVLLPSFDGKLRKNKSTYIWTFTSAATTVLSTAPILQLFTEEQIHAEKQSL